MTEVVLVLIYARCCLKQTEEKIACRRKPFNRQATTSLLCRVVGLRLLIIFYYIDCIINLLYTHLESQSNLQFNTRAAGHKQPGHAKHLRILPFTGKTCDWFLNNLGSFCNWIVCPTFSGRKLYFGLVAWHIHCMYGLYKVFRMDADLPWTLRGLWLA